MATPTIVINQTPLMEQDKLNRALEADGGGELRGHSP